MNKSIYFYSTHIKDILISSWVARRNIGGTHITRDAILKNIRRGCGKMFIVRGGRGNE